MTQEEFREQIEHPLSQLASLYDGGYMRFWMGVHIKATIGRTLRLCLKYPDLAKEYLDSLSKATMD